MVFTITHLTNSVQLPRSLSTSLGPQKLLQQIKIYLFFFIKTKAEALVLNAPDPEEDFRDGDVKYKKCLP